MAKRTSTTGSKLRFLRDRDFEEETLLLLSECAGKCGVITDPPIPIDEIVEQYLELALEFKDMKQLFGVDDIHGALWVNKRLVGIDQRLDPDVHPTKLGRYRFTLAHEAGHWRLHRHQFQKNANQLTLLPENVERPEYICRSSDVEPIEYQANRFASCLLMPRDIIKREWHQWRGSLEPIFLPDLRAADNAATAPDDLLLEQAIRPIAERFEVSPHAMRIRLEGLKLLARKRENMLF